MILLTKARIIQAISPAWFSISPNRASLSFANYKARKACNQLYGVTAQAPLLPLLTMADTERNTIDWDVKAALVEHPANNANSIIQC